MIWFKKNKDLKSKVYKSTLTKAESALEDKSRLNIIINKFLIKLNTKKIKDKFKHNLEEIYISIDLLIYWIRGDFKDVSKQTLIYIVGGILYFLMPLDAIPDLLLKFGFIDDFAVFGLILNSIKEDLNRFKVFKNRMENLSEKESRSVGVFVGLACGDALGTTLEFEPFPPEEIHDKIIGGGKFRLKAGEWTDDMSMALCLGHSLLEEDFDLSDQLDKYSDWMLLGYMSSNGRCFDIGFGTGRAITKYRNTGIPVSTDENSAGNGSIMRLASVPLYCRKEGLLTTGLLSGESSLTTHASIEAIESCRYLGMILHYCIKLGIEDLSKEDALFNTEMKDILFDSEIKVSSEKVVSLINGDWIELNYDELPNSGYVIDTMISALWCFYHTNNFKDAVVKAVNLAGDADTIGAVCGQIAGAYYGFNRMPTEWVSKIVKLREIQDLALNLHEKEFNQENFERIKKRKKGAG
jgi:ADP-ribosyl-[dinitrogen reductase] hydrolase